MAHIEIRSAGAFAELLIDGKKIKDVRKICFNFEGGKNKIPVLQLELLGTDMAIDQKLAKIVLPDALKPYFMVRHGEEPISKKEERIYKIMDEQNVDYDVAEALFFDEITQKYGTDDLDVAEAMFETDLEGGEE